MGINTAVNNLNETTYNPTVQNRRQN